MSMVTVIKPVVAGAGGSFRRVIEWPRLQAQGVGFLIEPHTRFRGQPGEQVTTFPIDPSGNGIELKAFRDPDKLLARQPV